MLISYAEKCWFYPIKTLWQKRRHCDIIIFDQNVLKQVNGGKEEPESLKMAEVISTDAGNITIQQLHDFVHKEYTA